MTHSTKLGIEHKSCFPTCANSQQGLRTPRFFHSDGGTDGVGPTPTLEIISESSPPVPSHLGWSDYTLIAFRRNPPPATREGNSKAIRSGLRRVFVEKFRTRKRIASLGKPASRYRASTMKRTTAERDASNPSILPNTRKLLRRHSGNDIGTTTLTTTEQ